MKYYFSFKSFHASSSTPQKQNCQYLRSTSTLGTWNLGNILISHLSSFFPDKSLYFIVTISVAKTRIFQELNYINMTLAKVQWVPMQTYITLTISKENKLYFTINHQSFVLEKIIIKIKDLLCINLSLILEEIIINRGIKVKNL